MINEYHNHRIRIAFCDWDALLSFLSTIFIYNKSSTIVFLSNLHYGAWILLCRWFMCKIFKPFDFLEFQYTTKLTHSTFKITLPLDLKVKVEKSQKDFKFYPWNVWIIESFLQFAKCYLDIKLKKKRKACKVGQRHRLIYR